MFISTSQELFYFVAAICLVWVSGFLCWALFEIARLFRQGNEVVEDTREKVEALEDAVTGAVEKLTNVSSYLNVLGEGGKLLLGKMMSTEDEDEEEPRHKKKKAKKFKLTEMP